MRLNERIDRALARSKDPDPHNIARKLMARMEQAERDTALAECLADRVRIQITRARLGSHGPPVTHTASTAGLRTEGPSKWKAMIEPRVYVPEVGWMFEVDMTVVDLRRVAEEYGSRAAAMATKAAVYRTRAKHLEASGCATWGEFLARGEQAA